LFWLFIYLFILQYWCLNSGLCTGALTLEPCPKPVLVILEMKS
jgi:hypothetical protein